MPLIGNARLAAPRGWRHTQPTRPTLGLTWHHVFPYARLAAIWNFLVNACRESRLPEAQTAIRQWSTLCDRRPGVEQRVDRLRTHRLNHEELEQFRYGAVWPVWDIVEGPVLRSDNPPNAGYDRFLFGLTRADALRLDAVHDLYQRVGTLTLDLNLPSAALRAIRDACVLARIILNTCEAPIPFRDCMWEHEPSGHWRKMWRGPHIVPG